MITCELCNEETQPSTTISVLCQECRDEVVGYTTRQSTWMTDEEMDIKEIK